MPRANKSRIKKPEKFAASNSSGKIAEKTEPSSSLERLSDNVLYFTLATAGHVDHGKTSLLRALTGIDPDRLKEEKERQMTTDIGFAHLRLSGSNLEEDLASELVSELVIGFIDVPGHGRFLKNMLAGVGGIDLAILVVAADEGPMPQTVQHLKILASLGIQRCILALTKMDLVEPEMLEIVKNDTAKLLGRLSLELLECVPVSNLSGEGIDMLRKAIAKQVLSLPGRTGILDSGGAARSCFMPVDRVFSKSGYGVVVTGTLINGVVSIGDKLFLEPGHREARVRGLETFGRRIDRALPGQRLAVNMSMKEHVEICRGDALSGIETDCPRVLLVRLEDFGGTEIEPLRVRSALSPQPIKLYLGTAERAGFLRWLVPESAPAQDGEFGLNRQDKRSLGCFLAQITLEEPLLARPGDRFVIRYGDYGIAGGDILILGRPRWMRREMVLSLMRQRTGSSLDELSDFLVSYIHSTPARSIRDKEISAILPPAISNEIVSAALSREIILRIGDSFIAQEDWHSLISRICQALSEPAREKSDGGKSASSSSRSQESLRVELAPLMNRAIFQSLIKSMIDRALILKDGESIKLAAMATERKISSKEEDLLRAICEIISQEACLELKELASRISIPIDDLKDLLELDGNLRLVIVNYQFVSNRETILRAHRILSRIWSAKRTIAPGDFRQELGLSRKYAMALLSYFDDEKITRRLDTGRVLLKSPSN